MANTLTLRGVLTVATATTAALTHLNISENGTYTPPEGYDGFDEVVANVPQPQPVIESKNITANGTYTAPSGVDGFSPVVVNVPQPQPVIESKNITANGTYTAPSGVDGFSPVVVNVPQPQPVIESKNITANGTYTAPSGVDGFSPVVVNVPSGATITFNEQNAKICDASDGLTGWQAITTPLVSGHSYIVAIKDATWHSNNIYYGLLIKDSSTDNLEMTIGDYTITLQFQANWLRLDSKSLSANMDMFINVAEVVSDYADGLGGV